MRKIVLGLLILLLLVFANDNNTTWTTDKLEKYTLNYDKNTTCLVRHIFVYKHPKWVAKIETRDGKVVYFSSPKSMFEFYFRPSKWYEIGIKSEHDFSQIVVTDYKNLKPIDAKKAFFIYGSRAISPAGDDLVAVSTEDDATKFIKIYGGTRVFSFDKVPYGLIKLLNNSL